MKSKRVLAILLVAIVILTSSVYALETRAQPIILELGFDGRTANCSVAVTGSNTTDKIFIAVELWKGNDCLKTWTDYGTAYVHFSDTYTVPSSGTYTLKVILTLNGTTYEPVTTSSTCS